MKILILGAAGRISRMLTDELLNKTDHFIVLYARNGHKRLNLIDKNREVIVEGDFEDKGKLLVAMQGVDLVYINNMDDEKSTQTIIEAMQEVGVKRVIAVSSLGIYDEVADALGVWNKLMMGRSSRVHPQIKSPWLLENSALEYTLLRLTWLYNQPGNRNYAISQQGEPLISARVTRQAVTQLVLDIINEKSGKFLWTSLGVSEPPTDWTKVSFD